MEIAVIHRHRYDDWTLPKGKLQEGESWSEAALREVGEETGYDATLRGFAGAVTYQTSAGPKVVRFWHMLATGEPSSQIDSEVARVLWFPVEEARTRLQYPLEQALLEVWQGPGRTTDTSGKQLSRRRWRTWPRPIAAERLDHELSVFEEKLDGLVAEQQRKDSVDFPHEWDEHAKRCVDLARQALESGELALGWQYLKAAQQFRLYGIEREELVGIAGAVMAEAVDERKSVTPWRREGILQLLADERGKVKPDLDHETVVRAVELLDEHHNNTYRKQAIVRDRLQLLSILSVVALIAWIAVAPELPSLHPSTVGRCWWGPRLFWLGLVLAGIVGAILSGFTSSIGKDVAKTRIPEELSASVITFSRLAIGAVSAVAVAVLLGSGVLSLEAPSYELLLAIALASGFTDRLLVRAVESTVGAV